MTVDKKQMERFYLTYRAKKFFVAATIMFIMAIVCLGLEILALSLVDNVPQIDSNGAQPQYEISYSSILIFTIYSSLCTIIYCAYFAKAEKRMLTILFGLLIATALKIRFIVGINGISVPYIIFSAIILALNICYYVLYVLLKSREVETVDQVIEEVDVLKGKAEKKRFINLLISTAQSKDISRFNSNITKEHMEYSMNAQRVYSKDDAERIMRDIFISATIFEGKKEGKLIKKQLKIIYEKRDYESIRKLYAEYSPRLEEYKRNLKAKGEGIEVALEYDGKGNFDGWLFQKIGWNILCNIVNVITLFIAYPATVCWKERWYKKHTVYDGKRLCFDGNGVQLFGKYICWLLLTLITFGIYGLVLSVRMEKWKSKHTHIVGEYRELGGTFDGFTVQKFFLSLGCALLNLITLFLVKPFTICWKERFDKKHTVYDGKRLYFDGNGFQLIGRWILWSFLTLITLGIFGFFVSIRVEKWKAKHTHLSKYYECAL